MKKCILIALTIFFSTVLTQVTAQSTLTLAKQQEDFQVFRASLLEMHAGLHWFITPQRFDVLFDSVYNSLTDNSPKEQFFLKLKYCMASLKHGHDGIWSEDLQNGLNYKMGVLPKNRKHLPLIITYLDQRLFVLNNCSSNTNLINGSEILSINGISTKQLSQEFCNYLFSNGRNTTFKYKQLDFYFQFQYLLQALHPSESYSLEIIPFGKKKKEIMVIDTELPQTIVDNYKKNTGNHLDTWGELLSYKLLDEKEKLGYLKIETFSPWRVKKDTLTYENLLSKIFLEIKKDNIKNLIVDVRNNEGGDDTWQLTTSYFRAIPKGSQSGLPYLQSDKYTQIKYIVKNDENKDLLALFDANPYAMIDKTKEGKYKLKSVYTEHDTNEKPLMPNAYSGKVYLLQNGLTFSAGFAFAAKLKELIQKDSGYIKIIGEDNGDDMDAGVGSGGWSLTVKLPNSNIHVNIPITGGGLDTPYSTKPVKFLDYKVIPTISDKINGVDTEVEFVKKLLKTNKI
ncbi:MAG: hypothetical protein EAZ47_11110 [Bacteroidetes bacterium]|nr:MAG: hypothetical protein EAZ47_11110 [Bacteroidota bacterium]